ncbi:MAG: SRPBCC domain-containing protein [Vitreoscilla sp.]|nr:SRPBCC domain-containing protein [Vitreoscilla sp.]
MKTTFGAFGWLAALWLAGTPCAMAAERALDKQVVVTATPEQVWAAWTTREGITSFFAPDAEIDARVGGAFHIHIDPLAAPGSRGADDMRYMALQAPRMLSFDWNAPPSLPEARQQRTFVVLRFEPVSATETRVSLHHTGWGDGGEWDKTFQYFDKAWGVVLGNLQTRFEKGPKDWTDWLAQLRQWHDAEKKAETKKAAED